MKNATMLLDRKCETCGVDFRVQLQSTKNKNGGRYCKPTCSPNYNVHLKKYIRNPLGPTRCFAEMICPTCNQGYKTRIKNINLGRGKFCSRKCNPLYAKKFTDAQKQRRYLLKKYGLTTKCYEQMVIAQNNECAICGINPLPVGKFNKLVVDHDHATGKDSASFYLTLRFQPVPLHV